MGGWASPSASRSKMSAGEGSAPFNGAPHHCGASSEGAKGARARPGISSGGARATEHGRAPLRCPGDLPSAPRGNPPRAPPPARLWPPPRHPQSCRRGRGQSGRPGLSAKAVTVRPTTTWLSLEHAWYAASAVLCSSSRPAWRGCGHRPLAGGDHVERQPRTGSGAPVTVSCSSRVAVALTQLPFLRALGSPRPISMATRGAAGGAQRDYQVAVLGASGFTGQFVVEELARVAAGEEFRGADLRWAIAGRSLPRLQATLERAAEKLGQPQLKSDVAIIICDVDDPVSLAKMCKQTSLVLDCVGPYRFYGEPVVKACVENGASCIDISGEPQFLEGMHIEYDSQAADKGVYIIGSSGFDSIPADLGVLFTRNKLKGTLTAVESFLSFKSGPEGTCIHDGTWQSAIHGFADQGSLRKLRKDAGYKPLPVVGAKLKRRGALFYSNELKQYSIPFLGSDASVVKRTQRYLHDSLHESPVQYAAYFAVGGLATVIQMMFAGLFFLLFAKFSFGRNLMIKYPAFFSFGYFTKEGPTQKQMEDSSFAMTFFGEGYSEGQNPDEGKPNVKICTQVTGPEAGYVTTPIAMVQAAVTLLKETSSLPKRGGVYTPGAAFSKTTLIERLNKNGIEFTVISKPEA